MKILLKCEKPYVNKKSGVAYGCGQCPYCKRLKMIEWTARASHEDQTQKNKNIFFCLTYAPKKAHYTAKKKMVGGDVGASLRRSDYSSFVKRLRTYIDRKIEKGRKIRLIACGEYGTKKWRPHYHLIVWGIDRTEIDQKTLEELWGFGHIELEKESAGVYGMQYVIGYIRKKISSKWENRIIYEDNGRERPFMATSQGIGRQWADENKDDWTRRLKVTIKGQEISVPRYYIKRLLKQEGKTIKYRDWKITLENKIKVTTKYKTIEKVDGKYTQKIWEARFDNAVKMMKELEKEDWSAEEQGYDIFDVQIWINKYKKSLLDRYATKIQEYKDYWNDDNNKRKKLWKIKKEKEPKDLYIYKDERPARAREYAKANNDYIRGGIYGNRDKYETYEELLAT